MATYKPYRKTNSAGTLEEIKIPASSVDGLSTVATSGSYNDLAYKPTIPTVNNGTLTIQKNGTNVQTFTANQSGNATANITVPTKVSQLTNDSGFITSAPANYTTSSRTPSQCTANGFYYVSSSVNSLTDANGNPFLQYHTSNNDFRILATAYSDSWVQQIATDFRSTHIYYRIRNNGTWGAWTKIANLAGNNTFTGNNQFDGEVLLSNRFEVANSGEGQFVVGGGVLGVRIDDVSDGDVPLVVGGNAGTDGQVLTSNGTNATPSWKSMPTYSLSGTTLTITLP